MVRVSGPDAIRLTDSIFRSASKHPLASARPNSLSYGQIVEADGSIVQPMDATQVEQLLGKLTPALGHLDQELLAARPFLASGQVSLRFRCST